MTRVFMLLDLMYSGVSFLHIPSHRRQFCKQSDTTSEVRDPRVTSYTADQRLERITWHTHCTADINLEVNDVGKCDIFHRVEVFKVELSWENFEVSIIMNKSSRHTF